MHTSTLARSWRSAALIVCASLLAVACGSDANNDASQTTVPTAPVASSQPQDTTAPVAINSLEADYIGTQELPPTKGPAPVKAANVWFVSCSAAAPGCEAPAQAAAASAELLGWDATVVDGQFGVGNGYNVAVRQAIAAQADAIVLLGIECETAKGGLQDAKAAGIVTISAASFDCADEPLFTDSMQWSAEHPDFNSWLRSYGAAKARWLLTATGGSANVIVPSLTESTTAQEPLAGFKTELTALCADCKITELEFSGQDIQTGVYAQRVAAEIVANPDADSFVCVLDTFCLAGNVSAAIASADRDFTVVGGEGLAPSIEAIRAGQMGAVTGYDTTWMGFGIADTVNRALAGAEQVPQGIGWQTVDSDHNMPPEGSPYVLTSIDYASLYKAVWGIG